MEHSATVFKALPTPTKQTTYTQPNAKRRKVQPQISRTNTDNEEDRAREWERGRVSEAESVIVGQITWANEIKKVPQRDMKTAAAGGHPVLGHVDAKSQAQVGAREGGWDDMQSRGAHCCASCTWGSALDSANPSFLCPLLSLHIWRETEYHTMRHDVNPAINSNNTNAWQVTRDAPLDAAPDATDVASEVAVAVALNKV